MALRVAQICPVATNQVAYFAPELPGWKDGLPSPSVESLPIVSLALLEKGSESDVRSLVLKPDGNVAFVEELPGFLVILPRELSHQAHTILLDKLAQKQKDTKPV